MKEQAIRKKFKGLCQKNGWWCWMPARIRFYENDILGIADAIVVNKLGEVSFFQLTTTVVKCKIIFY